MDCYFQFCLCQEARPSFTDDNIKRETKKKEKWMRFEKKVTQWDQIKINVAVKIYVAVKTHFSFSRQKTTFLQIKSLLQNIRDETIFSYVQNDLSVPDKQKPCFSNFPPIFKNIENWMRFEKKVTP